MRLLIVLAIFEMIFFNASAQTIKGTILTNKKEPIVNATVSLLNTKDSSLIKTSISDINGQFIVTLASLNPVIVHVSAVSYQTQYKLATDTSALLFILNPLPYELQTVVVSSKKPIIDVKPDKIVFNVENAINAVGSSSFDLLRKSPGVVIDNNDNISLLGSVVAIYIDGKPSPLTGKELADFLRSVQSVNVEAIELIKNPSAKYDAAGTGGIINIKLKKNKNYGANGNLNLGYGIGIFGKYNSALNVNYRNKSLNLFGTYSNNWGNNESYIDLYREQADSIYNQKSTNDSRYKGQNMKSGFDYFINQKNTIGFLATVFSDDEIGKNNAITPISNLTSKIPSRTLIANNSSNDNKLNTNFNINHHYTDTTGRELNTDIDYGIFSGNNNTLQPNQYVTPDLQTILQEKDYNIATKRTIHLFTVKSDYEQNFEGGKLGFGIKTALVTTKNSFNFSNIINGQNVIDNNLSNNFTLTENINAAYINYQKKLKKWDVQLGLRAEQTNTNGELESNSIVQNNNVKRSYLDFFPSFGTSFQLTQNNSLSLNYSRRINRPGYQSLNPFESKLDELSYQKGNPFLQPEYTNSFSLTHTYKYTLNTTISYSKTYDFSAEITDTTEGNKNYIQQRNAGTQQNISLNISYPFTIIKGWNVYANISASRLINKLNLGVGKVSDITVNSYSIYNQHTISLPKKYTIEVSGFYNSPSVWGGTFLNKAFWGIDAGVQKRFWQDKATLKLTVSDIFKSMHWQGTSNFSGLYMDASGGWESRQLKLNMSYRFGRTEIKKQRERMTGSADESKRL
jgi:outer membrane receptor protein involved in Fe transport